MSTFSNPKIGNIVATGQFPKSFNLEELYVRLDVVERSFEPEQYPALLVKINVGGNKRHVTLYRNGKYIIAGVKSEEELKATFKEIQKKLEEARAL